MHTRKLEEQRILRENHKILLKVGGMHPTPGCDAKNLKKQFEQVKNVRNLIAAKYLHRDEM